MRPRIRYLERESVRHPLRNVRLQGVIDRRGRVVENLRVQKGIVVDRIEGQTAGLSAKPKIVELAVSAGEHQLPCFDRLIPAQSP